MALTEEEKRTARAYNIGYLLSTYEPGLLDSIIRHNPKNEFVKAMQIGRDHREFHANIPRKDYTPEFKNGFYNGRSLAENNPELILRLINSKGLNKNYIQGLQSAQKEYDIRGIHQRMNQEPKTPAPELRQDESFQKGFNIGYRFAGRQPFVIEYSKSANEKYAKYLDGMKMGSEQYKYDLEKLREKNPNATIFPDDPRTVAIEGELIDHKIKAMSDVSKNQYDMLARKEYDNNIPMPKWLDKKEQKKEPPSKQKGKDKGIDHDL